MKATILTEGGSKIGMGHIARCLSLHQGFKKENIASKIIIKGDESILRIAADKDCEIIDWTKNQKVLIKKIKDSEAVVIDSYLADKEMYNMISDISKVPVFFDDTKRLSYPKGIIVNGLICAPDIDYPDNGNNRKYLLGTKYACLRDDFDTDIKKIIKKEIENILIICGGGDHQQWIKRASGEISRRFSFNVIAVGMDGVQYSAREIKDMMVGADLCITGGGQTIHELARCGVPSVGICFADNQMANLEKWEESGFITFAGRHSDDNIFSNIENTLNEYDFKQRKKMSKIGMRLIDGKGVARIIKEIIEYGKN